MRTDSGPTSATAASTAADHRAFSATTTAPSSVPRPATLGPMGRTKRKKKTHPVCVRTCHFPSFDSPSTHNTICFFVSFTYVSFPRNSRGVKKRGALAAVPSDDSKEGNYATPSLSLFHSLSNSHFFKSSTSPLSSSISVVPPSVPPPPGSQVFALSRERERKTIPFKPLPPHLAKRGELSRSLPTFSPA